MDELDIPSPNAFGASRRGFDPDPESVTEEAHQAHQFREKAFYGIGVLTLTAACVWICLMCNFPPKDVPPEAYYLWGVKVATSTVVILVLAIGILNFAIKCYGHHNAKNSIAGPMNDNLYQAIGKVMELLGKGLTSNSGS